MIQEKEAGVVVREKGGVIGSQEEVEHFRGQKKREIRKKTKCNRNKKNGWK